MCRRNCCPSKDTGPGLATVITIVCIAVVAIVVLRVIETILWGLVIAALATVATVLLLGVVMAWRYHRRPASVTVLPFTPPAQEAVTGAITAPGKRIGMRRQLDQIAADSGGYDRIQIIVIDTKNSGWPS